MAGSRFVPGDAEEGDFFAACSSAYPAAGGRERGGQLRHSQHPQLLKTPATVEWFAYRSGVTADGLRTRLSPELAYFYHSLGFAAQYYREQQKMQPTTPVVGPTENVSSDGFYVMCTYLLTGEERLGYTQQQIDPIRPFNRRCPMCSPGAWELVFRISRLDMDPGVFAGGASSLADSTKFSPGATESTCGVNWYWNKWVRATELGTRPAR